MSYEWDLLFEEHKEELSRAWRAESEKHGGQATPEEYMKVFLRVLKEEGAIPEHVQLVAIEQSYERPTHRLRIALSEGDDIEWESVIEDVAAFEKLNKIGLQ